MNESTCIHICKCGNSWSHFDKPGVSHCFIPQVKELPCWECTQREIEAKALRSPFLTSISSKEKIAILNNRVSTKLKKIAVLPIDEVKFEIECVLSEYRACCTYFNETSKTLKIPDNVKWYPERSDGFTTLTELPKEKKKVGRKPTNGTAKAATKAAAKANELEKLMMLTTGMNLEQIRAEAAEFKKKKGLQK